MLILDKLKIKAKMFRGFADPTRLAIVECLRAGEKNVSEIVENTQQSQSNVSNHLCCLLECGLVKNRRKGKNVFYSIRQGEVELLLETGDKLLAKIHEEIFACTRYVE